MSQFHISQKNYSKKILRSSYITLFTVAFLIGIKGLAFHLSNSIILLSVLADSIWDFIISLTSLILVRVSLRKSNRNFRWGFGKLESMASFLEALFILLISISILIIAVNRYFNPVVFLPYSNLAIIVMIISLIVTFVLVRYQTHVLKETNSQSVESNRQHYLADILTNLAAIIGLVLVSYNFVIVDSLVAGMISIYLVYTTIPIFKKSINVLIDKEIDQDLRKEIIDLILDHNKIVDCHNVRGRVSGNKIFLEAHLVISQHASFKVSHSIIHEVEENLKKRFGSMCYSFAPKYMGQNPFLAISLAVL